MLYQFEQQSMGEEKHEKGLVTFVLNIFLYTRLLWLNWNRNIVK